MIEQLARAVTGLDGSASGALRALDVVLKAANPWKDAQEPLVKCYLLICADELDKLVPNASSRIIDKMYEGYDR